MPHEGTDSILTAAQLVSALQSIVSRNVDPLKSAVVSVTQIRGGDTWNVLPDECLIRGTVRWYDTGVGDCLEERMTQLVNSVAAGFGCSARLKYERRYPATINDPACARLVLPVAGRGARRRQPRPALAALRLQR
jgi:hippurate hydrolase